LSNAGYTVYSSGSLLGQAFAF